MSKNISPHPDVKSGSRIRRHRGKGTPMYRLRAKETLFRRAVELLEHGLSIRTTARLLKVSPSSIQRWKKRINNFNTPLL